MLKDLPEASVYDKRLSISKNRVNITKINNQEEEKIQQLELNKQVEVHTKNSHGITDEKSTYKLQSLSTYSRNSQMCHPSFLKDILSMLQPARG